MKKSTVPGFFGMGATLLLTVVLTVLLVTFSLLSLATARGEQTRSSLLAQRQQAYYEANNRAELVRIRLSRGEQPEIPVIREGETLRYEIPFGESQMLLVELRADDFSILCWRTVTP